jgi:hypothetical protein
LFDFILLATIILYSKTLTGGAVSEGMCGTDTACSVLHDKHDGIIGQPFHIYPSLGTMMSKAHFKVVC